MTGYRVDPAVTTRCTETRKTVLERLTVACEACGERLLKESAVQIVSGAYAHSSHTEQCSWTNEMHVPRDLRRCAHTGVRVRADLVGPGGSLLHFDELEERIRTKAADDADLRDAVAEALATRVRVSRAWCRSSVSSSRTAFIAEIPGFLGLTRRKVAGILDRTTGAALGSLHELR
ncbi:MAG: hypothetical protein LC667_08930 [Thioalkalivibrio sp.]|nr:hypothetical protein [Thioalkalivibrio sp.]